MEDILGYQPKDLQHETKSISLKVPVFELIETADLIAKIQAIIVVQLHPTYIRFQQTLSPW